MNNELIERLELWIAEYDNPAYSQIVLLLKDCKEALEAKGEPVGKQMQEYANENCDWGDTKYLIKCAERYRSVPELSHLHCLAVALANKLKTKPVGEPEPATISLPYWLCCGCLEWKHTPYCTLAKQGYAEYVRYGTRKEHSDWQRRHEDAAPNIEAKPVGFIRPFALDAISCGKFSSVHVKVWEKPDADSIVAIYTTPPNIDALIAEIASVENWIDYDNDMTICCWLDVKEILDKYRSKK